MELKDKVAIVTGASAGVGRAYVLALAEAGATVVAAARTVGGVDGKKPQRNTLVEVVCAADELPGHVVAQQCDVSAEADVVRLAAETAATFGRIDVLVNNAGVYPHYPSLAVSVSDWDDVMRVNVLGCYLTMREVAGHMIRQRSGSIINLTSLSAERTVGGSAGHRDLLAYSVSKAGVNRLTTYMAEDLKSYGIAVNALSPGAVLTETFMRVDPEVGIEAENSGWGKPATPEVMGPAVLYLAQQTSSTLTGQILHTDEFGTTWGSVSTAVTP
ncbi:MULTISPECIES: SDR family oxidoreductase [unclassified Mycobacterium]|uniref:SDR family NAD(P)-dependent oxidoreductase n=1 Tax=unclassified Mycobacterium TaxID=2642494 RepID=UPI0029C69CE0|nr:MULTISPECIES: SDR family oxidoreductase [unclassified Mycobacterium]